MGIVSPVHIVVLLVVALLLFGAKRLPEIGRSLGTGMREFKDSVSTMTDSTLTPSELPTPTVATPSTISYAEPAGPSSAV